MDWELTTMRREHLAAGTALVEGQAGWIFMLGGEVTVRIGDTRSVLRPGDALLADPRTAYLIDATEETDLVLADLRQIAPAQSVPRPFVAAGFRGQHPGVAELVSACPLGNQCAQTAFAASYGGLIGAAMTSSWLDQQDPDSRGVDSSIADVVAAITNDPGDPWTLDLMAELAHLSRSALTDRFRRIVGGSPMQTLREVRMKRARELLNDPQWPVTRVAFEVGYGSVAAFSRAFAADHGRSPHAWRSPSGTRNPEQCPEQPGADGGAGTDEQRDLDAVAVEQSSAHG